MYNMLLFYVLSRSRMLLRREIISNQYEWFVLLPFKIRNIFGGRLFAEGGPLQGSPPLHQAAFQTVRSSPICNVRFSLSGRKKLEHQ